MIHLRVRTEFSFGETFAPLDRVICRLKAVGATAAGCVDAAGSTWGHVRWETECRRAGITPLFGGEYVITTKKVGQEATSWCLGKSAPTLYRAGSMAHLTQSVATSRPSLSVEQFLAAPGLVKFAGSALADSAEAVADGGVYLDLTPGALLTNKDALATARRVGRKARLVLAGNNLYAAPADRKLHELIARNAVTEARHILTLPELRATFANMLTDRQIKEALAWGDAIAAELADVKLPKAPLIRVDGDVEALCRSGQRDRLARGHIKNWTKEYEQRLVRELAVVREKQFDSYFLVVADMVRWAKERMLVGPARGSAAGSLMSYLMGITEVDPLPFGLMFERFVDITRKDLPDIDLDFPDSTRDQVYDYLRDKYGGEHVARIGTISEFKPKSVLAEVGKRLGVPAWDTKAVRDAMFERSSGDSRANNCLTDTLAQTEPGRQLLERYPAIALAGEIEGHASHTGLHAAGVIVCNEPIEDYCTVANGVAQLDKVDAEKLGLLKVDVLGLRTLSVIADAGVITKEQIYSMKLDDPAVFKLINDGRFSGIFQWEGQALQSLTRQIPVKEFNDLVHITALARPGPLGGGAATKYIDRHAGRDPVSVAHPSMLVYLEETFGLVLYQEQVMRIVRDIGQFTWEETSAIRKAMSGRLGNEYFERMGKRFMEGAAKSTNLKPDEARSIWDQINSMGMWAFNKSHSVSYALVSYWTAYLKAHWPLEYAAAALRNAKDEDAAFNMLREIVREGVGYVPFDEQLSEMSWSVKDGRLIGGFLGLKGIGPKTAEKMIQERTKLGRLSDESREKLGRCKQIFGDIFPAHSQWGIYYDDPIKAGLRSDTTVINISDMPNDGNVVFIGQLKKKDSRDHNEAVRLARRNGRRYHGNSLFLDMRLADDSTLTPYLCRIDRFDYEPAGRAILERGREDHHWFLVRGNKINNFPLVQVEKIRCLNDPELNLILEGKRA